MLYMKNKTKQSLEESKGLLSENLQTWRGKCGYKNEPRPQAEAFSLFCHQFVSCQSSCPSTFITVRSAGSALSRQLCSLKHLGGLKSQGRAGGTSVLFGISCLENSLLFICIPTFNSLTAAALCNPIYTSRVYRFCVRIY